MLVGPEFAETVVQYPVQLCVLRIDPDILRGGVEDQRTEVSGDRYRVHLLPEQVRGIQFHADVGCPGEFDELVDVGGVEHQILRVQF